MTTWFSTEDEQQHLVDDFGEGDGMDEQAVSVGDRVMRRRGLSDSLMGQLGTVCEEVGDDVVRVKWDDTQRRGPYIRRESLILLTPAVLEVREALLTQNWAVYQGLLEKLLEAAK